MQNDATVVELAKGLRLIHMETRGRRESARKSSSCLSRVANLESE
jgi:hypothetical protein